MSVEAIRAAAAAARDQMVSGHQEVRLARERLAEAIGLLVELGRGHGESLLPPEHAKADERLAAALELLAGSLAAMDRFVAAL